MPKTIFSSRLQVTRYTTNVYSTIKINKYKQKYPSTFQLPMNTVDIFSLRRHFNIIHDLTAAVISDLSIRLFILFGFSSYCLSANSNWFKAIVAA